MTFHFQLKAFHWILGKISSFESFESVLERHQSERKKWNTKMYFEIWMKSLGCDRNEDSYFFESKNLFYGYSWVSLLFTRRNILFSSSGSCTGLGIKMMTSQLTAIHRKLPRLWAFHCKISTHLAFKWEGRTPSSFERKNASQESHSASRTPKKVNGYDFLLCLFGI